MLNAICIFNFGFIMRPETAESITKNSEDLLCDFCLLNSFLSSDAEVCASPLSLNYDIGTLYLVRDPVTNLILPLCSNSEVL